MRVLFGLPLRQDAGFYPIAVGLDGVGLGRAGLLDLVASPRGLGGGVAEKTA